MDFEFNGTFIGIYGAKRPGYGLYQIKLDGHLLPTFDASSATPLYNQTLFNATVPNGFHQVQLINAGNTTLDVDYVGLCELYWDISILKNAPRLISRVMLGRKMNHLCLLPSKITIPLLCIPLPLPGINPQDQERFLRALERMHIHFFILPN